MNKDSDNDEGPENDTIGPLIIVETPETLLKGKPKSGPSQESRLKLTTMLQSSSIAQPKTKYDALEKRTRFKPM